VGALRPVSATRGAAGQTTAAALLIAAATGFGCGNSPKYTLPAGPMVTKAAVTMTTAMPGTTVSAGAASSQLCVLSSLQGAFLDYAAFAMGPSDEAGVDPASDESVDDETSGSEAGDGDTTADQGAGGDGGGDATLPLSVAADVSLYIDPTGSWAFSAQGNVTATAACVQWSAFAGVPSPAYSQYENGGISADGGDVAATDVAGQTDCFLSNLQGDYSDFGNGALVNAGGLTVANPAGMPTWAAAICFDAGSPVAFTDFTVDARDQPAFATLPSPEQAICGIVALSAMNATASSIAISGSIALGNESLTTIRCFYYQ
jgi:hypothetical protein